MDLVWIAFSLILFPGMVFASVAGLLLTWEHRKLVARFQWRVGPPIYQPFADFIKLLNKEMIIPNTAYKPLFIAAPILAFASSIVAALIIPIGLVESSFAFTGDLIVIIYLLLMPSLALILGGIASGNPYASVGSSRKVTLTVAYELGLVISILTVALGAKSMKLSEISLSQFGWYCPLAAIAFLFAAQAKVGLIPFDQPEAKTEIMGGALVEYSGVGLGLFKLANAILLFSLSSLMVAVFFPGPFVGLLATHPWDIVWHLVKVVIIVLFMSIVSAVNPRFRIDQSLKFFWTYVLAFAILNCAAVVIYITLR